MQISDEMLMAFADGELAPSERAPIEAALAQDPALQARVEGFRASRRAVAGAFLRAAPAPDPLADRIRAMSAASEPAALERAKTAPTETAKVIQMTPKARRSLPFWQMPVAAGIALAVGVASAGYWLRDQPGTGRFAALQDPALDSVLSSLASGSDLDLPAGGKVVVIASFEDPDGVLCREFEVDEASGATTVAVACHAETGWAVQLAVAADSGAEGYAPASSLETLDAWLTATGAAAPMSAEEEVRALESLSKK